MNDRAITGKFVTETFGYDGGRQVTVYVPPDPPEAIIFSGDGQAISKWGELLEAADTPPVMIAGVHSLRDEKLRLREYSPGFDPARFAAHEKFFVEDVRQWIHAHFGLSFTRERTAMYGASAGGELALALGIRHPKIYGAILCASPGAGYKPTEGMPVKIPSTYLVAGLHESFFLENAMRWANALNDSGVEVVMKVRKGSHGSTLWKKEFPRMVAWAFSRSSNSKNHL